MVLMIMMRRANQIQARGVGAAFSAKPRATVEAAQLRTVMAKADRSDSSKSSASERKRSLASSTRSLEPLSASPAAKSSTSSPTASNTNPAVVAASSAADTEGSAELPQEKWPGVLDDANFEQHWTVGFWRQHTSLQEEAEQRHPGAQGAGALQGKLAAFARRAQKSVQGSTAAGDITGATYWAYHAARLSFFGPLLAASVLLGAARRGELQSGTVTLVNPLSPSSLVNLLLGLPETVYSFQGMSSSAIKTWEVDLKLVKEGVYKLPWEMTTPSHRQFNPFWVLPEAFAGVREQIAVTDRRAEAKTDSQESSQPKTSTRLPFMQSPLYPKYYQTDFHYQTDGWFSNRSANAYNVVTEMLFFGQQDAMQRSTLIPMAKHLKGSSGEGLNILEVGAGTGRFTTFVRDNYPYATLTVSDLSPFYLEKAREELMYWEAPNRSTSRRTGQVQLLQCAAENVPLGTASQDVVYCVYLFHELPPHAQRDALQEFSRLLKPGGLLVMTDSVQQGDRPILGASIKNFASLNEPYYADYTRELDFGGEMKRVGLQPQLKCLQNLTKCVSAVKPLE